MICSKSKYAIVCSQKDCGPRKVAFIAWSGHWVSHFKHCTQSLSLAGKAFFSDVGWPGVSLHSYTCIGQTSRHMPQPLQISQSTPTAVPRMPSFSGGFTGPQMAMPSSLPDFFLFFRKSRSIVKRIAPPSENNS